MAKFRVGDKITVIDDAYRVGQILTIEKVGRRYLWVRGKGTHASWRIDRQDSYRIILAGERSDVIDRLASLRAEYSIAVREYERQRSEARWAFDKQWAAKHPEPPYTVGEYFEQLRKEAS